MPVKTEAVVPPQNEKVVPFKTEKVIPDKIEKELPIKTEKVMPVKTEKEVPVKSEKVKEPVPVQLNEPVQPSSSGMNNKRSWQKLIISATHKIKLRIYESCFYLIFSPMSVMVFVSTFNCSKLRKNTYL